MVSDSLTLSLRSDKGGSFRMKPNINFIPNYNNRQYIENILLNYKQFYRNWYPTNSRLLSYKEFVMLYLEDDIEPTEANRRYEQYITTVNKNGFFGVRKDGNRLNKNGFFGVRKDENRLNKNGFFGIQKDENRLNKNGFFKNEKDENRLKDHHHPSNKEAALIQGRNANGKDAERSVAENGNVKEESFVGKERLVSLLDEEFYAHIVTLESPFICGVKDCYKGFIKVEDGLRHLSETHGGIAQPCILKAIYYMNNKPLTVPAQGRPVCHYDDLDAFPHDDQEIDYTRNDYRS